ncbi:MAG: hypothetical protein AAFY08_09275 [Planctomycetota bacterium]
MLTRSGRSTAVTLAGALITGVFAGCSETDPPAAVESPAVSAELEPAATQSADSLADTAMIKIPDGYPLDTCVVSDEKLGSMGEIITIEVEGRDVLLCCAGCESMVRAEPAKYLAMLDAASTGRPTTAPPAGHNHDHDHAH